MEKTINILVVEDKDEIIEQLYKRVFSKKEGLNVDYASSELEAKEKIKSKTYHIAYVDIMLREDRMDRGGVEVIKYMHDLNEPTSIIVVSATDDIRVALDTYKAGIYDYIQKETIQDNKEILIPLDEIIESKIYEIPNPFGRFSNINAYLAHPTGIPYWDDRWTQELATNYKIFTAAISNSTRNLLPIIRKQSKNSCLNPGEDNRTAYDFFWSKGLGKPIMLSLAFSDSELPKLDEKLTGKVIYEKSYRNLNVAVTVINSGMSRSDFLDSVWEGQK